jgi:hypothetical protein
MQPEWFEKLKAWLQIKDNIKIQTLGCGYRSCYSTIPIKQYESIVKIKSKYLIEYSRIEKIYPIEDLEYANSLVAFYLMVEDLDPNSSIRPYLDSLPKSTDEFVLSDLEQEQMTQLANGSKYLTHLEDLEADCVIIYTWTLENKCVQFDGSDNFEEFYSRYIHYRFLVGSRIFGYERDGHSQSGLVPYIDMFNHSFEPNAAWEYNDQTDSFVLQSIKSINPGEEIVDSYGCQNNFNLFVYYGFVSNPNPYPIIDTNQIDKSILESHINKIKKKQITNPNIAQLYLDEIQELKNIV